MKIFILFVFIFFSLNTANATNYHLATTPLYLGDSVEPNIFFELDDSGSMDWEVLAKKYWHYCAYDPDSGNNNNSSSDCGWEIDNGLFRIYSGKNYQYFYYMFDNNDDAYSNNCYSSLATVDKCSAAFMDEEWRIKSSSVNVLYYNPIVTYEPWVGTGMTNADFSSARSDPQSGSTGYSDKKSLNGFVYHVWKDTHGWKNSDSKPYRGSNRNRTAGENGVVDLWDEHTRYKIDGNNLIVDKITYSPTNTDMGEVVSSKTISGSSKDSFGRTVAESKQNIANWYQYYRKRSYVTKAAVSLVMNKSPSFRYGLSVLNYENRLFKEVPGENEVPPFLTHNKDIAESLFKFDWPSAGTPLRRGLEYAGKYYDHVILKNPQTKTSMADPIISSCQQNFTVLFTDGYWNGGSPTGTIGDADGDKNKITIADVAMYYYKKDLSGLANNLLGNSIDPAKHQHMVSFTVAFGVQGNLIDSDGSGWPDLSGVDLKASGNWGNPFNSNQEKIDDMWHAAYNSKGKFVSAATPQDVVKSLEDAIVKIGDRTSNASAVSANTSVLTSDTLVFKAGFESGNWLGELLALPIKKDGTLDSAVWNAATVLDAKSYNSRVILSSNGTDGVAFRWPVDYTNPTAKEITTAQTSQLLGDKPSQYNTTSKTQRYGKKLVNYLRGDDSNEGTTSIPRDSRKGKLGDIVDSAPYFVSKPAFSYPDDWVNSRNLTGASVNTSEAEDAVLYSDFITANKDRSEMVYVGANDGMLHGFFAEKTSRNSHSPGEELIAYVPSVLFSELPKLTRTPYDHYYYVNNSPVVTDVFYKSSWHTVLVGSLGAGGQGFFALDVTKPDSFAENTAKNTVLWEFTDKDDADLGYSFSKPSIVRLHNGKWAAIFGNGYNNTFIDNHYSKDTGATDNASEGDEGQAVLYIVDIETGRLIKKLETLVGISNPASGALPNGLSTPNIFDTDNDFIADYVYAGDLYGNLWKFDITDIDPSNWFITFGGKPLFTACAGTCSNSNHQPITVKPAIAYHPKENGTLVYFGTGKYFELDDNSGTNQDTQTFYGVWDKGPDWSAFSRSNLQEQKILKEISQDFDTDADGTNETTYELRYTSKKTVDWTVKSGWFMDLINNDMDTFEDTPANTNNFGERVIASPVFKKDKIVFNTLIPPKTACDFGGSGWLMLVDAGTGGRLSYSPLDLNNDDNFDLTDFINIGDIDGDGEDDYVPMTGKNNPGIMPEPGFQADDSDAGVEGCRDIIIDQGKTIGPGCGRQIWNEL
ncbi:MAG: PilC/PilY family type IV pilus protein [Pseudomonadota bacterium]